jgi:MYXO-CTERM domain-containing protein
MRSRIAISAVLAVFFGLSGAAGAEEPVFDPDRPIGTYVKIDPPDGVSELHNSNVIYLNACWGGCTITGGQPNDSRNNVSSIVNGTVQISQFNAGQAAWDAVVQCVKEMYEPFDIEITDQDPGSANHFEAIVAGRPQEIGAQSGVGGVAPFSCGVINNAITFSFANIYGGSVQAICEVVAQETAHAFGLDHEYLCEDPMTYLNGCGPKTFHDVNAPCGEFSQRQCQCGGSTQNSVQKILAVFGPGTPTPPTVNITEPGEGSTVDQGFVVRADITDNTEVTRADLIINSRTVQTLTLPPWAFNAPTDLSQGIQQVEVRAYDNYNSTGSDFVNVTLGSPCGNPSDCNEGETCIEGRCVPGPGTQGGLGEACERNEDCASNQCASDGTGMYCIEQCDSQCPDGFGCIAAGDVNVCWPGAENPDPPGGCCQTGGDSGLPTGIVLVIGALLLGGLRRRRRA